MKPLITKVAKSTLKKIEVDPDSYFLDYFLSFLKIKSLNLIFVDFGSCMLKNSCKSKNLQDHYMRIPKIVKSNMLFNFNNKLYHNLLYILIYYCTNSIYNDRLIIYDKTIIRSIILE